MDAKTISLTQIQTYLASLVAPIKAGEEIILWAFKFSDYDNTLRYQISF